jgi:eukaryotic-like serine/threonine-protein kinase
MPPMTLGGHQNIVYIVDERQGNTPTFGTLKRYDVTTGSKTEIIKIAKVSIYDAQISTDGQWILFVAYSSAADKLQMIRMDGQDLQTLYCTPQAPGIFFGLDWSPDERLVSFVGPYPGQLAGIYILNLQSGSVQLEAGPFNLLNSAWLDNTHLYMMPAGVDARTDTVYMLDLSRGANQPSSNGLVQVYQQPSPSYRYGCVDYDTYGGSKLFISQCTADYAPESSGIGKQKGPSTISVQLPPDASLHSIFTSPTLAITMVRAISGSTLLLLVDNYSADHSVDTSQNGLWKINMDGSGLARLTAQLPSQYAPFLDPFCAFTRTPWANGSRDGSMYSLEVDNQQSNSLLIGSVSGGSPITIASISAGTRLSIVGWTTM